MSKQEEMNRLREDDDKEQTLELAYHYARALEDLLSIQCRLILNENEPSLDELASPDEATADGKAAQDIPTRQETEPSQDGDGSGDVKEPQDGEAPPDGEALQNGEEPEKVNLCEKGCAFCEWLEIKAAPGINCQRVGRRAGEYAAANGGQFIFYCRSGLIHFAAPVIYNGRLIATVNCGPVRMHTRDSGLVDLILEKMSLKEDMRGEIVKRIIDIPMVAPYQLAKAAEALAAAVSYAACVVEERNGRVAPPARDEAFWANLKLEHDLAERIAADQEEAIWELLLQQERKLKKALERDLEYGKNLTLTYIVTLARICVDHNWGGYVELVPDLGRSAVEAVQTAETAEEVMDHVSAYETEFLHKTFLKERIVHNAVVSQVLDYVNRNYMNKISLDITAESVFLSASYLSKIFKEEVGCNFNTYLNKLRIDKARKLLTDDNLSIVEVANLVGFDDQSYFSKVFRRLTGTTPKKYKDSSLFG